MSGIPIQTGGTGSDAQAQSGALAQFLANNGVPYADAIGSAISFFVALLAVYIVGRAVIIPLIDRVMDARGLEVHARNPLRKLTLAIIVFVAIAVAFGFAGYGSFLQSLATVAAAATLAIGFALQNVIANFVAGIFIFTDKPFKIGDWIEWDGNSGIVEDISFRVTRVRTFDNELLTVPNSELTDGVIKNPVAKQQLRLQAPFGIGYDDDIERANEIILEEAHAHPEILDDPAPSVRLAELGDSSVVLKSRVWIDDPSRSDFVKTRGEYVTSVKERFDEEDINIPYPNRTLGGSLDISGVTAEDVVEG
ncbi:mechanosensitive ion channel family protein [Haloplanus aerogenes]|uniref:Mechanosensitive ion channel family protein n=1 Tax=Haloplanus aerogenes TaxID=660522 RepID=A0A3M0D460_9EURY|nr:mechanosensitive ion channel family protein [Haloplanus aerogenes]AZH24977.1 mechanosensitive ion channel family protein [Haloplanus aerogenes]RMB13806.1 mechanosensitive ion channel-like protein [Haloplanus aerogenes]